MSIGRTTSIFTAFFSFSVIALGQNWTPIGPGAGSDLLTARFQPDNANIIYLAGDIEGIFKTTDGGQNWRMINRGLGDGNNTGGNYGVQEIVIDPNNYQTVYACTWQGMFRSTDGGENWSFIFPEVYNGDTPPVSYMAVDPANSDILYAGIGDSDANDAGAGEVYRSTNGGAADWVLLDAGLPTTAVIHGIKIDPTSPVASRHIMVSTDQGVYRSLDNGLTWNPANTGLPHQNARRMEALFDNGNFVLLLGLSPEGDPAVPGSYAGGIFKSTDFGATWTDISGDLPHQPYEDPNDPPPFYDYWKFTVSPTDPNLIYAATNFGNWGDGWGIYKTIDGGGHWSYVYNDVSLGWMDDTFWPDHNYTVLRLAPSDPTQLIAGSVRVLRSSNAGQSWTAGYTTAVGNGWQGNGVELMIAQDIAFDPTDASRLYVGYDDFGFWRSDDGGSSFIRLDPYQGPFGEVGYEAALSIVVDPANGDVYLGRNNGDTVEWQENYPNGKVWKSTDQGVNWTEITTGLPEGRPQLVMDTSSPTTARVLYCASYGNGVYKSTNSGATWSAVNDGLGAAAGLAFKIVMDSNNPQILYVGMRTIWGGTGGIYKTTDGGANWSKLATFPEQDILCLAVDPNDSQILYAGAVDAYGWSESGGLYKSDNGGADWSLILDQPRVNAVIPIPGEPDVVYADVSPWFQFFPDQESGFYYSSNGGSTWENIGDGLGHKHVVVAKLNPHNTNQIMVGTLGGGIWKMDRSTVSIADETVLPHQFKLELVYPNPFNPSARIRYNLTRPDHVTLTIYNVLGQPIRTVVESYQVPGNYQVEWNGQSTGNEPVASGIYFAQLSVNNDQQVQRMVLLK